MAQCRAPTGCWPTARALMEPFAVHGSSSDLAGDQPGAAPRAGVPQCRDLPLSRPLCDLAPRPAPAENTDPLRRPGSVPARASFSGRFRLQTLLSANPLVVSPAPAAEGLTSKAMCRPPGPAAGLVPALPGTRPWPPRKVHDKRSEVALLPPGVCSGRARQVRFLRVHSGLERRGQGWGGGSCEAHE